MVDLQFSLGFQCLQAYKMILLSLIHNVFRVPDYILRWQKFVPLLREHVIFHE